MHRSRNRRLAMRRGAASAALLLALLPASGRAQSGVGTPEAAVPDPAVAGRRRLTARRVPAGTVRLDGRLDEPAWQSAPVAAEWSQVRPDYRPAAGMRSTVRVLFDDEALYVGAILEDSAGAAGLRVRDLARDFAWNDNESFTVVVSGLGDRRTATQFSVTPWGNLRDVEGFDGGSVENVSWDGLWSARTTRTDAGWMAELAIPWATLRYRRDVSEWDVNFVRNARRTLETSAWSPYPRQLSSFRLSYAGVVDSLQPPPPQTNLRMRPYALGEGIRTVGGAGIGPATVRSGAVGGELIWAPTPNVVVEGTLNTDFAQADVDRQVVNLTRFSVFFPERRQFFLESADVLGARGLRSRYTVEPFFTRRIGLSEAGAPIPVTGGARTTYRSSTATGGVLAMRQQGTATSAPATFGVVRGARFFGKATNVGGLVAVRHDDGWAGGPAQTNVVTAIDGLTRVGEQIEARGMLSTSTIGDRTGLAASYFVRRDSPNLYTGILGAWVDADYAPRTGFVSRSNVLVTSPAVVGTVQPTWLPSSIVWLEPTVLTYFYHDPRALALQEGYVQWYVKVLHTDGTQWYPYVEQEWQRPTAPVNLFAGVSVPAGAYDATRYGLYFGSDASAPASVTLDASTGGFFDGSRTSVTGSARWAPDPRVTLSLSYDVSRLRSLGTADTTLTTQLFGPEVRLAASPRLQLIAFYQHNTAARQGTLNARLSWEFSPLSFAYLIWNRGAPIAGALGPTQDALLLKVAWLRQL